MTTAKDAPDAPVTARAARPLRIGLRRRFQLRRLGRRDGCIGMPDPTAARAPLTTDDRSMLRAALFADVSVLWERYYAARAIRLAAVVDIDTRLPGLRAAADAAQTALTAAANDVPDAAPRPGEQARGRSPELLVQRRARAHERRIAALAELRGSTQQVAEDAERRRTRIVGDDLQQRKQATIQELIATFIGERTIYDQALVRRHPQGKELRPLLDRSSPQLSGWAWEPSEQGGDDG